MKKGFTLVELLAVIIILGLVGLIVIPSITKVVKDSREKLYQKQIQLIEESSRKWGIENIDNLSRTKKTYLSVDTLINRGYIEQSSLHDPRNVDNKMNGCVVVEFNHSKNKYMYNYTDQSCREINTDRDLTSSDPEYVCYEFDPIDGVILYYDKTNLTCSMDVVIPNKIDGVTVRFIGESAFCDSDECDYFGNHEGFHDENKENTLITFLETKEKSDIEFSNMSVEIVANNLSFAPSKKLSSGSYIPVPNSGRYVESVVFPESIVGIGMGAFAFNNIDTLDLEGLSNLRYIEGGAFTLNRINTLDLSVLSNLQYIGEGAFSYNNITTLNLEGLTKLEAIGNYAFESNLITSLNLEGLTKLEAIGFYSFAENNITTLNLTGLTRLWAIFGNAFVDNQISNLVLSDLPSLERIGHEAFEDNNISSLDLTGAPNLFRIGWDAFSENNITTLNLEGLTKLEEIGGYAFGNNLITSITIPASVVEIGEDAFWSNPITSVTIEGDDIYRFNGVWINIGFPKELMQAIELTVVPITLSTSSANNFDFTDNSYYRATVATTGTYKLEVWGAQGGGGSSYYPTAIGGKGGYSTGTLTLTQGTVLNVYVGGVGSSYYGYDHRPLLGGFNGGGHSYICTGNGLAAGGGATDIRVNGITLYHRIIVAGGGGGAGYNFTGGAGGGTSGQNGDGSTGGTQSAGGTGQVNGSFGQGGGSVYDHGTYNGGGGGWYGGGSSSGVGGAGGSGYVLTSESFKPTGYIPTSTFHMTNGQTFAGNVSIPNPSGGMMIGRLGNGYARITYLGA